MITTARIPEKYFIVKGVGQSDFGPGVDPWETTSYDIALLDAGIGDFNIVQYSSVLPPEATEISLFEARKQNLLHHGMVLESIMAQVNGRKGEHLCAGVGLMKIYKDVRGTYELLGGFAAEYEGNSSVVVAEKELQRSLQGMFDRRYGANKMYIVRDFEYYVKDLMVESDFGTVLVALGFVSFIIKVTCDNYSHDCACIKKATRVSSFKKGR